MTGGWRNRFIQNDERPEQANSIASEVAARVIRDVRVQSTATSRCEMPLLISAVAASSTRQNLEWSHS